MTQSPAERDLGTWGALFGLVVIAIGLLGLVAMVAPQLLGIALVIGGFIGFGSLHYLLWGWWLGRRLTDDQAERDAGQSQTRDK